VHVRFCVGILVSGWVNASDRIFVCMRVCGLCGVGYMRQKRKFVSVRVWVCRGVCVGVNYLRVWSCVGVLGWEGVYVWVYWCEGG